MTPYYPSGSPSVLTDPACILPFEVNWSAEVIERLGWRMAAVMTQSGAEQRASLRREPRLGAEFTTLIHGGDVALLRNVLLGWANRAFAVPLWWASHRSTLAIAAGGTSLALDAVPDTLIHAGQWVLLWASPRQCEAVQVSATGNPLTLAAGPASSWPAGTRVLPLAFMQLQDSQPDAPITGTVTQVSWSFEEIPGKGPGLPEQPATAWTEVFPDGASNAEPRNHFFGFRHNWGGAPQVSVNAVSDQFDPGTGVLSRRLASDFPSMSWSLDVLLDTREQTAQLRKFLSAHAGPTISFWAPSITEDLRVTGLAGTALAVRDDGQASTPSSLHRGVWLPDAGIKRLVSAVGATSVTLAATASATADQLTYARWVMPCRLAVEEVSINHVTGGTATVRLPVVAVDTTSGAANQGEGGEPTAGTGSGTWVSGGGQGVYPGAPTGLPLIRFEQALYTLSDPATTVTMALILDVPFGSTTNVSIRVYDGGALTGFPPAVLEVDGWWWTYPQGTLTVSVPAGVTRHEFVFDHAFWREDALDTTIGLYITAPSGYSVGALQTTRSDYVA